MMELLSEAGKRSSNIACYDLKGHEQLCDRKFTHRSTVDNLDERSNISTMDTAVTLNGKANRVDVTRILSVCRIVKI